MALIHNGQAIAPAAWANDRGLLYGDGLFSTFAIVNEQALNWAAHWQRLAKDCQRLHIPLPEPTVFNAELSQLCQNIQLGVGKCLISRGSGGRGYLPAEHVQPMRLLSTHPWPAYPAAYFQQGVQLGLCQLRLGAQPALAGIKHLNRLENVLARQEIANNPAQAEALLLDQQGFVIEGTMSNLFFLHKGVLHTPSLHNCGVAGIMRGHIIETAQTWGVPVAQGNYPLPSLFAADEVFISNSILGIWPVRSLLQQQWPLGSLTQDLQQQLLQQQIIAPYA